MLKSRVIGSVNIRDHMANKIEHLEVLAREIEKYAGGFENVATLTHCMTRIRLVLKDNSKFDAESLKQIEGVKVLF